MADQDVGYDLDVSFSDDFTYEHDAEIEEAVLFLRTLQGVESAERQDPEQILVIGTRWARQLKAHHSNGPRHRSISSSSIPTSTRRGRATRPEAALGKRHPAINDHSDASGVARSGDFQSLLTNRT